MMQDVGRYLQLLEMRVRLLEHRQYQVQRQRLRVELSSQVQEIGYF
jgi:hypothetical protein